MYFYFAVLYTIINVVVSGQVVYILFTIKIILVVEQTTQIYILHPIIDLAPRPHRLKPTADTTQILRTSGGLANYLPSFYPLHIVEYISRFYCFLLLFFLLFHYTINFLLSS